MTALEIPPSSPAYAADRPRHHFLGAPFDGIAQDTAIDLVTSSESLTRFRYVVTPNVDHVVRLNGNRLIAQYYEDAWMSLCDSKPISALAHAVSLDLPLVTGSDLTARLFKTVIKDGDLVTLIAADSGIVRDVEFAYPTIRFRSLVPPKGVLNDPTALQTCVDFVAAEAARFVFIAIGSPQSEKIAHALAQRPDARGVGLCVGASLEFLVGTKKRAPFWMRRAGLEWAHRLASDPKRLWRRYVFAVAPLAQLFVKELVSRQHRRA
jgi:exopolysaccharide biosynthesis WecB/TagA/CpsF family protein